jgi:hypothetical protein
MTCQYVLRYLRLLWGSLTIHVRPVHAARCMQRQQYFPQQEGQTPKHRNSRLQSMHAVVLSHSQTLHKRDCLLSDCLQPTVNLMTGL